MFNHLVLLEIEDTQIKRIQKADMTTSYAPKKVQNIKKLMESTDEKLASIKRYYHHPGNKVCVKF